MRAVARPVLRQIDEANTKRSMQRLIDANELKPHGERVCSGARTLMKAILFDYCKKVRFYIIHLTHERYRYHCSQGNLAMIGESCRKTAYNRLKQLLDAGWLVEKQRSRNDFGKGERNCLVLEINPEIVHLRPIAQNYAAPAVDNRVESPKKDLFQIACEAQIRHMHRKMSSG